MVVPDVAEIARSVRSQISSLIGAHPKPIRTPAISLDQDLLVIWICGTVGSAVKKGHDLSVGQRAVNDIPTGSLNWSGRKERPALVNTHCLSYERKSRGNPDGRAPDAA